MTTKERVISACIITTIAAALFGGIALAVYTENATWLILSVVAFCIIYAG